MLYLGLSASASHAGQPVVVRACLFDIMQNTLWSPVSAITVGISFGSTLRLHCFVLVITHICIMLQVYVQCRALISLRLIACIAMTVSQLVMVCENLSVQAAEAWKKATEEERAPHVAAAEQEKEVYEKLSAEYTSKKDADVAAAEAEALASRALTSQVEAMPSARVCCLPNAFTHVHQLLGTIHQTCKTEALRLFEAQLEWQW